MSKVKTVVLTSVLTAALCVMSASAGDAPKCKIVKGYLESTFVTTNCNSPVFCAEGRYSGRLKGEFWQVGTAATPASTTLDPSIPGFIFLGSADIMLETNYCNGTLYLKDVFVNSFAPADASNPEESFFSAVHTVMPETSTGGCKGVTGQLRVLGTGTPTGVIHSEYDGVICSE